MFSKKIIFSIPLLLFIIAAGCGVSNDIPAFAPNLDNATMMYSVVDTPVTDDIIIEDMKALIKDVEWKYKDGSSGSLEGTAFIFDYQVTNGLKLFASGKIPNGIVQWVRFRFHVPEENEVIADPEFTSGGRASMVVKYLINGTATTFRIQEPIQFEFTLSSQYQMLTDKNFFTVAVNKNVIFKYAGQPIEPNQGNLDLIKYNLIKSFRIFVDNNQDGLADQ